jgi:hypothetical protein
MLCFVYRGLICRGGGGRVPARRVGGGSGNSIDIQNVWRSGGGGITPNSTHTYPHYTYTYIMAKHWLPRRLRAGLGCKKLT